MSLIREALKSRLIEEIPKYKKSGILSHTVFVAKCPTVGCQNTVRIEKLNRIHGKCRSCSSQGRQRGELREYKTSATDIDHSHLTVSKKYKDHFIREELTTDGKAYIAVMRCPKGCGSEVRLRNREILRECRSCCRKGLPYERTYNHAITNTRRRSEERTKAIEWSLPYDDFAALCSIPNCHYCNVPLNRAKYKADEGSIAVLLDRKDSNKDYTLENCVPCCAECNFTKHERISYDEMVLIMKHRGLWADK